MFNIIVMVFLVFLFLCLVIDFFLKVFKFLWSKKFFTGVVITFILFIFCYFNNLDFFWYFFIFWSSSISIYTTIYSFFLVMFIHVMSLYQLSLEIYHKVLFYFNFSGQELVVFVFYIFFVGFFFIYLGFTGSYLLSEDLWFFVLT